MTALCAANVAAGAPPLGDGRRREAFLIKGRDAEKRLAARVNGLYVAEDNLVAERPVYRKADQERPTLLFYNEEKKYWRICHQLDAKGEFAKAKDKGDRPWQVSRPWKVFEGNKEYAEDPDMKVVFLDVANLPPDEEVEICLPQLPAGAFAPPPAAGSKREAPSSSSSSAAPAEKKAKKDKSEKAEKEERSETAEKAEKAEKARPDKKTENGGAASAGAASASGAGVGMLPEDAPPGHLAHTRVKVELAHNRACLDFMKDKVKIRFQTTASLVKGDMKAALVIARACFVKFQDEGWDKDQVTNFRNECYDRFAGRSAAPAPAAKVAEAAPAKSSAEPPPAKPKTAGDSPPAKKAPAEPTPAKPKAAEPKETPTGPPSGAPPTHLLKKKSGKRKRAKSSSSSSSSSDSDSGGRGAAAAAAAAAAATAAENEAAKKAADADASAAAAAENEAAKKAAAEMPYVAPPPPPITKPPMGGGVSAKMAVRSGLRCTCCYAAKCKKVLAASAA